MTSVQKHQQCYQRVTERDLVFDEEKGQTFASEFRYIESNNIRNFLNSRFDLFIISLIDAYVKTIFKFT